MRNLYEEPLSTGTVSVLQLLGWIAALTISLVLMMFGLFAFVVVLMFIGWAISVAVDSDV
jgi:hypothetical protein